MINEGQTEDLRRLSGLLVRQKQVAQLSFRQIAQLLTMAWRKQVQAEGERMLNDEELAKKGFRAMENFIEFRQNSVKLVEQVFPIGESEKVLIG